MSKHAVIIGSGLGGLATALRLSKNGYAVTVVEKHSSPGGRLNRLSLDGFTFDLGPSFMSMSYELRELFESCDERFPLTLTEVDPVYQAFFEGRREPFRVWKDIKRFAREFAAVEPDCEEKLVRYLSKAAEFFHDTENRVIRTNFTGKTDYLRKLTGVPIKHLPYLFRNMWQEAGRNFESKELRVIMCLVAFFLGSTPFQTPAIYSLLNYTELRHDGYWTVKGGMYRIVEELVQILRANGVKFVLNTEIIGAHDQSGRLAYVTDQNQDKWPADIFVCNADAAAFRGNVLKRAQYSETRLDRMDWSLAPFTIYLGVRGKLDNLLHHNYFLGSNFTEYAGSIFRSSVSPQKPYYYLNVPSKSEPGYAPEGCESLFILCPVPDLRYKKDWTDKDVLAENTIHDLSERIGFDISGNTLQKKILTPEDWACMFNLYKGSGLGLNHGLNQVGALRPSNKDEKFTNVYYVGASTIPGTGLPMVIISSKLTTERIMQDHGSVPGNLLSAQ